MSNATKEIWLENVKTGVREANVRGAAMAGFPDDTHYFDVSFAMLDRVKSNIWVRFSRGGQVALCFVMCYWDGIEMVIDDTHAPTREYPWASNSYEMQTQGLMTDADIASMARVLASAIYTIRERS